MCVMCIYMYIGIMYIYIYIYVGIYIYVYICICVALYTTMYIMFHTLYYIHYSVIILSIYYI